MIWMIIATICAGFVKGLCGFANTLVFTSICSFTINNIDISPVDLLIATPGNYLIAFRERKYLKRQIYLPPVFLVLLGDIPGIFLLKNVNAASVKVFFGFIVILIGIQMMFKMKSGTGKRIARPLLIAIGFVSGLLCGLFGVGALMSAYVGSVTEDMHEFRGNMSMIFCMESTFRVIAYIFTGIFTLNTVKNALVLIPFMLFAVMLGMKSGAYIDEKKVKKLVILLLIISGLLLIVNNI